MTTRSSALIGQVMRLLQIPVLSLVGLLAAVATGVAAEFDSDREAAESSYDIVTRGTRSLDVSDRFAVTVLLEQSNLGGSEFELAEFTFRKGYRSRGHSHGATEVFYVLSGRFGHLVNGQGRVLEPGEVGVVRPGDSVEHFVEGEDDARVLVIWTPGGEVERLFGGTDMEPVAPLDAMEAPD